MPRLSWPDFVERHPAAHLLAGAVPPDGHEEIGTPRLRRLRDLLARSIGKQPLAGDYALTVVRQSGQPEIHCGFSQASDAERIAALVRARRRPDTEAPCEHYEFPLDEEVTSAIEAALQPERKSGAR